MVTQLRYLQTLNNISAENNSTIIFPVPVDVISNLLGKGVTIWYQSNSTKGCITEERGHSAARKTSSERTMRALKSFICLTTAVHLELNIQSKSTESQREESPCHTSADCTANCSKQAPLHSPLINHLKDFNFLINRNLEHPPDTST